MNGLEITDIKFRPVKDRAEEGKSEIVAKADVVLNDMIVINDICIFEYGSNKGGFSGFSSIPFTEYDRQSVGFTSQELDRKINHEILDAYVDFKNNGISESRRPRGRMLKESENEPSSYKYTIYVDGEEYGYDNSFEEAKEFAYDLCAEGHEVTIVDNFSGLVYEVY